MSGEVPNRIGAAFTERRRAEQLLGHQVVGTQAAADTPTAVIYPLAVAFVHEDATVVIPIPEVGEAGTPVNWWGARPDDETVVDPQRDDQGIRDPQPHELPRMPGDTIVRQLGLRADEIGS